MVMGRIVMIVIQYDQKADALYIKFGGGRIVDSLEVNDGIIIDFGEDGSIIGIEIINFSKRGINLNELLKLPRERT